MLFRLLIVLPVLAVALFLYGAIVSIGYIEENRCRMTYMFEHPQYTRLPVQGNERFPKYGLYAYSEGFVTQRVQQRLFTGAPVLFVPGSGGSYKQVRSLASVALRKGLDNNWQAHLDYFSVDLNEELSGVYGGYLQDQTDFLDLCIQEITRLYGARGRTTRLFIVGHSVGGKLAQAVVGARTSIGRHVAGIVTLSAPVDKPVALFDHYHYSFYDRIEQASLTKPGPLLMLLATGSLTAKFLALFKAIPPTETVATPLAVSILVHLVALGVLVLATLALWGAIAFCANFAHKIILRLIALPIPVMSSTFLSCIHKFPLAIAVLLVAIALTACGGVSLLCAAAVYFVLLSKAYEDYLENFVFNTARKIAARLFGARERPHGEGGRAGRKRNRRRTANETGDELMVINFHLPLFLLVILLALLNVPSVITWAKNYHYANTLQPDPSLVPALAVLVCLAVLWQLNTPRNVCGYELLSALLVIGAFVSVLYCQVHVYRLNYLLALVFVAITVHQIIAPKRREVREEEEEEEAEAGDGKEAVEGVEQAEHEEEETGDKKAN
uniref:GPI inositol-deacylase n=1 Tax=Anopheles coluzzii TaxID=1518534 RepID=A0A8W7PVR7_ANOCL